MKSPKVTVLMSVYNGEKYLREAIDSILSQTFRDFEFLIVDDGSTDSSRKIILSYDDPRIVLIKNKKNIGLTKSLNKGIKRAKGKYIARMDADDVSLPHRLEAEMTAIGNSKGTGMVTGWVEGFDGKPKHNNFFKLVRSTNSPEEIFYGLLFSNCIAHSTVLFNKEIVLSLGGYDEAYRQSQDFDLWIKVSHTSKIIKVKDILVKRRFHESSTTRNSANQQKLNSDAIFLKNMHGFCQTNTNPELLLRIACNDARIRYIAKSLRVLDTINKNVMISAPQWLDREKLEECGKSKKRDMVKTCQRGALFIDRTTMCWRILEKRFPMHGL